MSEPENCNNCSRVCLVRNGIHPACVEYQPFPPELQLNPSVGDHMGTSIVCHVWKKTHVNCIGCPSADDCSDKVREEAKKLIRDMVQDGEYTLTRAIQEMSEWRR